MKPYRDADHFGGNYSGGEIKATTMKTKDDIRKGLQDHCNTLKDGEGWPSEVLQFEFIWSLLESKDKEIAELKAKHILKYEQIKKEQDNFEGRYITANAKQAIEIQALSKQIESLQAQLLTEKENYKLLKTLYNEKDDIYLKRLKSKDAIIEAADKVIKISTPADMLLHYYDWTQFKDDYEKLKQEIK